MSIDLPWPLPPEWAGALAGLGLALLVFLPWAAWRARCRRRDEARWREHCLQAALEQSQAWLTSEFEALASRVLDEKGRVLAHHSRDSLDALLQPLREQIDGFRKRVDHVHDEAVRGNAALSAEIRQIGQMGRQLEAQAGSLATALRGDNKAVGNWGEVQLERSLQRAGLVRDQHYRAQPLYHARDGQRRHPDFVLDLPDGRHLVIDCKVSLLDHERALAAATPEGRCQALDALVRSLRQHIDGLAGKDYSRLDGLHCPGFVFMYLPVEAAYIAALGHAPDLYEYAWRRRVVLVSHTTLLPVLRTLAHVWALVGSHEQASELAEQADALYGQVCEVAARLKRLGGSLGAASRHYNEVVSAVAGREGLSARVSQLAGVSARAAAPAPEPGTLEAGLRHDRLDSLLDDGPAPD